MYLPDKFKIEEIELIKKICTENAFVTLLALDSNGWPSISHVPVYFDTSGPQWKVRGHLSRHNPQWKCWATNNWGQVLVHGPHTYITPLFYKSGRDVPTWNYVAIHLTGQVTVSEKAQDILKNVSELTKFFEEPNLPHQRWTFSLPDDLKQPQQIEEALVCFEMTVEKIEPKFKLSQNRPAIDKQGIVEGLAGRADENSLKIKKLMQNI